MEAAFSELPAGAGAVDRGGGVVAVTCADGFRKTGTGAGVRVHALNGVECIEGLSGGARFHGHRRFKRRDAAGVQGRLDCRRRNVDGQSC